jgi:DNA-binding LytR/AlgR family response regulator
MINPFKKPFKELDVSRGKFVSILIFGLFIFLFLFLFKPFGITQLKPVQQLFVTFGFGLVTSFMLIIFKYLIEPLVPKVNWTLGKSILFNLLIAVSIGVANYFYICIIFPQTVLLKYLFSFILSAILVGIIPVTVSYMVTFNRIYKTALLNAAIKPEEIFWENEVIIKAGNPKNELKCDPKNIIYLCSNDNYVTIVTIKGNLQQKTTLRGTLKSVESELRKNSRFLRCHKCYIVNLDYVERITGNNQSMLIRLLPQGIEIPVSRAKADLVTKLTKKS